MNPFDIREVRRTRAIEAVQAKFAAGDEPEADESTIEADEPDAAAAAREYRRRRYGR
jgi:hypothetical protein